MMPGVPTHAPPTDDLADRVNAMSWYHTMDLGPGLVTPGFFDTRPTVPHVPLPQSLAGMRCLDVGTWDGFWAFEMERRGAGSVTAIDIEDPARWDWPPQTRVGEHYASGRQILDEFKGGGQAFALAREALDSQVERVDLSIYDLDPRVHGQFDFVFLGSLLLHLRDPVRALDRLRGVCGGEIVIAEMVEAIPSWLRPRTPTVRLEGIDRPWWWQPNLAALHRMVESAGFEILRRTPIYFLPHGAAHPKAPRRAMVRFALTPAGREQLIGVWRGLPHAAVLARPAA
jgi:tRNA (mo5U34)-methyltransferase